MIRPDHRLTPGALLTANAALVCRPGWASAHRHVTARVRGRVFARYRLARVAGAYEVDHLISLELGGSNDIRNRPPEPYATARGRGPRTGSRTASTSWFATARCRCGQAP